jgi:serine/threonine protein kinase
MNSLTHHPNMITLIGYSEPPDGPLAIVTKLCERNLTDLLVHVPTFSAEGQLVSGFELGVEWALHIMGGIANGMNEMHELGLLHRDLKSANVLVERRIWPAFLDPPKDQQRCKYLDCRFESARMQKKARNLYPEARTRTRARDTESSYRRDGTRAG